MKPTNDRLMQKAENAKSVSSAETEQLLEKWILMNWVRAGMVMTGTLLAATATLLS